MKRLLVLGILLAILMGSLSSCSGSSTSTTDAASSEPATATASAPTPPARPSLHVSYTRCDQNISAGSHTTCGFADNVFRAFAHQVSSEGAEPANYTVQAVSPDTGKTYSMACHTASETTICAGGQGARVRFPLTAAQVYYRPSTPQTETSPPSSAAPEPKGEATEPEGEESGGGGGEPGSECTNGTYTNSAGNTVCKPEESSSGAPAGATARCGDGTYSFSESRSGTCSHHEGVAEWLG
jgi:hypothetical protein